MLNFQILVPVLTPDAVPGCDGPSLLELDLFSLMVSQLCSYQLEHCTFTIIEVLPPLPEMTHGLSYRGSFKKQGEKGGRVFFDEIRRSDCTVFYMVCPNISVHSDLLKDCRFLPMADHIPFFAIKILNPSLLEP